MEERLQARLRAAEVRAKYYRDQYDFLLSQIPNPTFLLDPANDRIVEVNEAACQLLGYTKEELTTEIHISDVHPDEMALFREFGEQVYTHGSGRTERLTCMTSAGRSLPVTIHATLLHDHEGRKLIRAIVVNEMPRHAMQQALLDEVKTQYNYEEIIGSSPALQEVLGQVGLVAPTDAPVLIRGETGTGKELICRAIHHRSPRRDRPLVKLNSAAIPSGLVESELFGHEKGAFTGAISQKRGRFELAHEGTIFLDEVGDIPLDVQPKLLRLLQEQAFERLGGTRTIRVDVRVIAATHRDLESRVRDGTFREDLFYRLNVFPLTVPPLRAREEDIPMLARYFAERTSARHGRPPGEFSKAAIRRLLDYEWPGNVRELENVVERALILCGGGDIEEHHVHVRAESEPAPAKEQPVRPLEQVEREHILAALSAARGKLSGRGGAAEMLGLKPTTLASRMKKLGISRGDSRSLP